MILRTAGRLAAVLMFVGTAVSEDPQHVIVVLGAAGRSEYAEQFQQWADHWQAAAESGDADFQLVGGNDDTDDDLQILQQALSAAAVRETPEPLWLVLIGHGTFDGRTARFNLNGPDVSATELHQMLKPARRPIAVINCTSSSAPFINALSGPNRIVITATKDGNEFQFARFGGYLAEAIGSLAGDLNRDGQTSLLEAWLFAANQVQQFYESDGRLATEHSLLDDSGDARGSRSEIFEGVRIRNSVNNKGSVDGKLAAQLHLVRSELESRLTAEQRQQRNTLEEKLELLRKKKDQFSEKDYLRQLEEILVPLARLYDNAQNATEPNESNSDL